jgi:uncharacterized RDD family membrane protein YckC
MTVQATTSALAPAAVATRVIAYIIDAIILGVIGIFLVGALYADVSIVGNVVRTIIFAALSVGYFGYTWTAWRASPGQRILGLMTVNTADGAALTWNQATIRWAFLFVPSVLQSLFSSQIGAGIGSIVGLAALAYYIYLLYTTATDARKQGFHDKQANTLVITKIA